MLDFSRIWYSKSVNWVSCLMWPLSFLFFLTIIVRRRLYRLGLFKCHSFRAPVVIVGNITVGGTGKTPTVIWLVKVLQENGYRPGIVSRGYGGKNNRNVTWVKRDSSAIEVGDEALLIAQRVNVPVVVCRNRVKAARDLLKKSDCNIVISDDGLQHYALDRAVEIAVVDGARGVGNGFLLPAGPLREPISRLKTVDLILMHSANADSGRFRLQLIPDKLVPFHSPALLPAKGCIVHAVAGVGNPERFFFMLRELGFDVIPHVFSDHYRYSQDDFVFEDDHPIIMTEKDAVKCRLFSDKRFWYLPVQAVISENFTQCLLSKLKEWEENSHAKSTETSFTHLDHVMQQDGVGE